MLLPLLPLLPTRPAGQDSILVIRKWQYTGTENVPVLVYLNAVASITSGHAVAVAFVKSYQPSSNSPCCKLAAHA